MRRMIKMLQFEYLRYAKKCSVHSPHVSFSAVSGENIIIMNNTHVDQYSSIGSYSYIGYDCFITRASLGRYVSMANKVSVGLGEHRLDNISTSSLFYNQPYETLTKGDCSIGNDCWIGVGCVIRRGVKIGNGAVVGANSFVNKNIPDFAIAVGSPAKVIKYRFEPEQIRIINESRWWEYNIMEARKIIDDLRKKICESI